MNAARRRRSGRPDETSVLLPAGLRPPVPDDAAGARRARRRPRRRVRDRRPLRGDAAQARVSGGDGRHLERGGAASCSEAATARSRSARTAAPISSSRRGSSSRCSERGRRPTWRRGSTRSRPTSSSTTRASSAPPWSRARTGSPRRATRSRRAPRWRDRARQPRPPRAPLGRPGRRQRDRLVVDPRMERDARRPLREHEARPERDAPAAARDERDRAVGVAVPDLALRQRAVGQRRDAVRAARELERHAVARDDEQRELVAAELAHDVRRRVGGAHEHERAFDDVARVGERARELGERARRAVLDDRARALRRGALRGRRRRRRRRRRGFARAAAPGRGGRERECDDGNRTHHRSYARRQPTVPANGGNEGGPERVNAGSGGAIVA